MHDMLHMQLDEKFSYFLRHFKLPSSPVFWTDIKNIFKVTQMMESDIPREIFSKLFCGSIQFNLNNSITAMKRLNEGLEYGVSLELINGPGLSFHSRITRYLLSKSSNNIIKSFGLDIMQLLTNNLGKFEPFVFVRIFRILSIRRWIGSQFGGWELDK